MPILSLAMPIPLRHGFDYLPPTQLSEAEVRALQPGIRISAPFGKRQLVGILLIVKDHSDLPATQLKTANKVLDAQPVLPFKLLTLCRWAAHYYQCPIGDALANAIPTLLRKGKTKINLTQTRWRLTTEGKGLPVGALTKAAKQAQLIRLMQQQESISSVELDRVGINKSIVKALIDKGLVEHFECDQPPPIATKPTESPLTLNPEQRIAVETILSNQGYQCYLLEGITGSGKTEVYLQLISQCLANNQQALVLIPEIGLTPQALSRFERRFNCPIAVLHSGLTERERLLSWQSASSGEAGVIIGTRSAVFTPLAAIGLIIVDEEHDGSFKQQDGFRYSARDVAIKRAADEQCAIVLGSATPSLESLNNALSNRYHHLPMKQRATGASSPSFELLDIRNAAMQDGFSSTLISAISDEITAGNQVLIFINRRGFSPMLTCPDCDYVAQCKHCDARMTVHFQQRLLRCHHCESKVKLPNQCPDCHSTGLDFRGIGTQRSEKALQLLFPNTEIVRIDRDTTMKKQAMQHFVAQIHRGQPCILVGTQMLAKGHHFPDVTLVAVLDADGGLFNTDFRGPEKMGQLLVQVAGRAGRSAKPGKVMVQTHHPDHPLITSLISNNYHQYALKLLTERRTSHLPPFGYLALVRSEANNLQQAELFLNQLRKKIIENANVQFFGPLPAPMTKRANRYRAQLLLQSKHRKSLHYYLQKICHFGDRLPLGKKVKWSIDVDPNDMF